MKPKSQPLTVLHVTESFGGGVATALAQYVLSTPELEHHLLMGERQGDFSDSGELALFASVASLPSNPLAAVTAIRRLSLELKPHILHAHSSFAGAYVRLARRSSMSCRIIYTPHGYSFQREDISKLQKHIFRSIERLLTLNTSITAACSPHELQLAQLLNRFRKTVYVPNVAADISKLSKDTHGAVERPAKPTIAAVGRITAARDPLFFTQTVRTLRSHAIDFDAVWIGGGEERYADQLEKAGVRVTGWLARKQVMEELSRATLHVHTAAWDAFPMVLLEANAQRIPSLIRPLDAFSHIRDEVKADTPSSMAKKIATLLSEDATHLAALANWDSALADNTREVQHSRLYEAYSA